MVGGWLPILTESKDRVYAGLSGRVRFVRHPVGWGDTVVRWWERV